MDKSGKRIRRRDFMRVVGGALVATEMGVAGCSDENSTPAGNGPDSGMPGPARDGGQSLHTGGMGSGGTSGSPSGAGGGLPGAGGGGGAAGSATGGTGGDGQVVTGGSGGSAGQPEAGAGQAGTGGSAGQPSAGAGQAGSGGSAGQPSAGAGQAGTGGAPPQVDGGPGDNGKSKVYIVKTTDRMSGTSQAIAMAGGLGFAAGRDVVLKPNFNSSYPLPGSTHDDTIRQIVAELKDAGAGNIILGESSGSTVIGASAPTEQVTRELGTLNLCSELGIDFVNYDDQDTEYENFQFPGMSWVGGLAIPKLMRSDRVKILMPCCKTHMLADFTFSLKLAVGLVPRDRRWSELHPDLPNKIPEINMGFEPDLIVMDAMLCFIDGGPNTGTTREPGLIVASTDRIAMDAVGIAILKAAGSAIPALQRGIFQQGQLVRAVELGLGATSPDDIELIGDDDATIAELRSILDSG